VGQDIDQERLYRNVKRQESSRGVWRGSSRYWTAAEQ